LKVAFEMRFGGEFSMSRMDRLKFKVQWVSIEKNIHI
jgi:hypothetical protein